MTSDPHAVDKSDAAELESRKRLQEALVRVEAEIGKRNTAEKWTAIAIAFVGAIAEITSAVIQRPLPATSGAPEARTPEQKQVTAEPGFPTQTFTLTTPDKLRSRINDIAQRGIEAVLAQEDIYLVQHRMLGELQALRSEHWQPSHLELLDSAISQLQRVIGEKSA